MQADIADGVLRGVVLQRFYDLRHEKDWLQLSDVREAVETDFNQRSRLANICDQLAQHGLIQWKRAIGLVDGMGKIMAPGVDVIEGTARAPITITLHDHSIAVSGSSHVQIGNSNVQGVNLHIEKLIAAVDHSHASETEKAEAKSLLAKLMSNPLVQSALNAVFGGSGSAS